jgi:hypothetical protein
MIYNKEGQGKETREGLKGSSRYFYFYFPFFFTLTLIYKWIEYAMAATTTAETNRHPPFSFPRVFYYL